MKKKDKLDRAIDKAVSDLYTAMINASFDITKGVMREIEDRLVATIKARRNDTSTGA